MPNPFAAITDAVRSDAGMAQGTRRMRRAQADPTGLSPRSDKARGPAQDRTTRVITAPIYGATAAALYYMISGTVSS